MRIKNVTLILIKAWEKENELLIKTYEKEYENNLWECWKLQYPGMDKETFISYADFKKQHAMKKANKVSKITYEEIEKEMEQVIKAHEEKGLKKN